MSRSDIGVTLNLYTRASYDRAAEQMVKILDFKGIDTRQYIHTEKQDYFINLVFYNFILKRFVQIDMKTQKIIHLEVVEMDMYILCMMN